MMVVFFFFFYQRNTYICYGVPSPKCHVYYSPLPRAQRSLQKGMERFQEPEAVVGDLGTVISSHDRDTMYVSTRRLWVHEQDPHKINPVKIPAGMDKGSWSPIFSWGVRGNWWLLWGGDWFSSWMWVLPAYSHSRRLSYTNRCTHITK